MSSFCIKEGQIENLSFKGQIREAVDNQSRVRQEMANFLRFGKITIKLQTSQKK